MQTGKRVVVDVDLAKFFDRVNHDILIDRLRKRIDDAGVIRLVRAYLSAGIMDGGVVVERHMGTPQGGPLSPLLANVLLDEVDKVLEARGYSFARYADDCNVYVGSMKAGQRVMALLGGLYAGLKLQINAVKSAVGSALGRKFLGYALWGAEGREVKCAVAAKPLRDFKARIRQLTRRSGGRSMEQVVQGLRPYLLGWKAYFGLAQTPEGLARAGRVAASPIASDPAQTLEAAGDDVPRAQGTWRGGNGCAGEWRSTVAAGGVTVMACSRPC